MSIINVVSFKDWQKLDLRVGKIEKVEDIEGADNLYKLSVDVGESKPRTLVAGLKKYYKAGELKNKKAIFFTNLEPRTIKGIESKGMILAAVSEEHKKVVLISPEKDVEVGMRVS